MTIKTLKYLLSACLVSCAVCTAHAQEEVDTVPAVGSVATDTLEEVYHGPILTSKIHLMTRTYGDRIYLRWLPEDYVSWMFLVQGGVNVLRVDKSSGEEVTLARGLKPLSQAEFESKYGTKDSLAMVCAGVLYGEGRISENQTQEPPRTMGANMEYNSEQDISFGYAMLIAEWRADLAQDMAVGLVDRSVKPDARYEYYVQPTVWDNGGKIIFEPGVRENVVNRPYEPEPYDPLVEDTLPSMCRFVLSWEDKVHSSYEIERREKGTSEWQRLNKKPYVSMVEATDYEGLIVYSDSVPYVGVWEYRIFAHDAFGELVGPSPVHTAYARDIQPPLAPQLKYIVLERPDDNDPMSRILAHVVWENPDPEKQDGDVQGYVIQYYNEDITGHQWRPLTQLSKVNGQWSMVNELISPKDTTAVVDVTGLRTGMMALSAYDNSGNENMGLAQMVRITDFKAPEPPEGLKAIVLPSGNVLLSWQHKAEDTDIAYYDLAFSNDSTHEFLLRNQGGIQQEGFIDTLAMNINQKYIYYKVRGGLVEQLRRVVARPAGEASAQHTAVGTPPGRVVAQRPAGYAHALGGGYRCRHGVPPAETTPGRRRVGGDSPLGCRLAARGWQLRPHRRRQSALRPGAPLLLHGGELQLDALYVAEFRGELAAPRSPHPRHPHSGGWRLGGVCRSRTYRLGCEDACLPAVAGLLLLHLPQG